MEFKAAEDCTQSKTLRAKAGASIYRQVLECGSPLPLLVSAICCLVFAELAIFGSTSSNAIPPQMPPKVMREFRGAWIATKGNIDWPSKPALPVAQQKAELIALMDKAAQYQLNALLFQVRPACDALYKSSIEPWSYYLTGRSGQAPNPAFDPLEFAIEQAHARGLELHAWFNPYRAGFAAWDYISPEHIIKKRPDLVRRYGPSYWLDPGEMAVQDHTTRVILDVVRRYDIDGVHMDDYFYPYPELNKQRGVIDFPDGVSWKKYRAAGGKLARADWRRENVNKLIQRLNTEIKKEKKWMTFGVSPFGIWRPGYPEQIKGLDAYERLYADARLWLAKGWVDYLAPQLYWAIDPPAQSFAALLNWWHGQNERKLAIWPGGAVTQVGRAWHAEEIMRQVDLARATATPGYIHWNLSSLARNPEKLGDRLAGRAYGARALVPATTGGPQSAKPILVVESSGTEKLLKWSVPPGELVSVWVLQTRSNGQWTTEVLPASVTSSQVRAGGNRGPELVALSVVNRFRMLSPPAMVVP